MPDVQLVGVCDENRDVARACATAFGVTGVFTDADEMLRQTRPDVVHLLTPPQSHVPLVRCAARHGAHVYVEKPFARSESDAREMAELARDARILVCPGHNRLFDPVMLSALRRVESGAIGRVIGVRAEQGFSHESAARGAAPPWSYGYPWGIFENLIPHPLYLASHFLSEPGSPSVVAIDLGRIRESAVDEIRVLIPSREAVAEVTLSLAASPESNRVEISGTQGRIIVDLLSMTVVETRPNGLPSIVARVFGGLSTSRQLVSATLGNAFGIATGRIQRYAGVRNLIAAFYDAVRQGAAIPPVTLEAGILNARLMDAIRVECSKVAKRTIEESHPERLAAARVLVTGATGFVGGQLVSSLAARGTHVRAAARIMSRGRLSANVVWLPFELRSRDDLRRAVAGVDTVFHCAALVGAPGSPQEFEAINSDGSIRLLEAAREAGVSTFIYLSSIGVYGIHRNRVLDERAPYDSRAAERGLYTQTKLAADQAVLRWSEQNPRPRVVVLRPGTIYGVGAPLPVGRLVLFASDSRPVVAGSRRITMSLTHVANVIDAMIASASAQVPTGSIFNIVDSSELTQGAVAATLSELTDGRIQPTFVPYPIAWGLMLAIDGMSVLRGRGAGTARYRLKRTLSDLRFPCEAARRELGWSPRVSLREGLAQVLAADDRGSPFPH
jgi:nucleoside-diphosphate-sugar epimerase/predicted dehydrogenase